MRKRATGMSITVIADNTVKIATTVIKAIQRKECLKYVLLKASFNPAGIKG